MDVLSWLGAYHVKNEMYEKAIEYFHMASQIQPHEVLVSTVTRPAVRPQPFRCPTQPWARGWMD
jgi:hypothetical protein